MPAASTKKPNPPDAGWRPRRAGKRRSWFGFLLLAGVAGLAAAALRTPGFHARAQIEMPAEEAKELSRDCVRRGVRMLDAVLNQAPRWEEDFAAKALNAWLGDDFVRHHGGVLPAGAEPPVVEFDGDLARVGFRWGYGPLGTVVHTTVRLWVPKSNLLAVELHGAAAGSLPLPASVVRQLVERVARSTGANVTWRRHEGRQVALLKLSDRGGFALQRAEIKDGALRLGGRSAGSELATAMEAAEAALKR
jgi:hypothetical protein